MHFGCIIVILLTVAGTGTLQQQQKFKLGWAEMSYFYPAAFPEWNELWEDFRQQMQEMQQNVREIIQDAKASANNAYKEGWMSDPAADWGTSQIVYKGVQIQTTDTGSSIIAQSHNGVTRIRLPLPKGQVLQSTTHTNGQEITVFIIGEKEGRIQRRPWIKIRVPSSGPIRVEDVKVAEREGEIVIRWNDKASDQDQDGQKKIEKSSSGCWFQNLFQRLYASYNM